MEYFPQESPLGLFRSCRCLLLPFPVYFQKDYKLLEFFNICRVYADMYACIGDVTSRFVQSQLELTSLEMRLRGATMAEEVDKHVTHVLLHNRCLSCFRSLYFLYFTRTSWPFHSFFRSDLSRISEFRALNRQRTRKFHIVCEDWVSACVDAGKMLSERSFEPTGSWRKWRTLRSSFSAA